MVEWLCASSIHEVSNSKSHVYLFTWDFLNEMNMLCKFNVYKLTSPLPQTTGTTLESGHLDPAGQMVQVVKPVVSA